MDGELKTANIYARRLTDPEIDALANGEPPVPATPPIAVDDLAALDEDGSILIDVLANDADPNNETLTLISAGGAENGVVALENGEV